MKKNNRFYKQSNAAGLMTIFFSLVLLLMCLVLEIQRYQMRQDSESYRKEIADDNHMPPEKNAYIKNIEVKYIAAKAELANDDNNLNEQKDVSGERRMIRVLLTDEQDGDYDHEKILVRSETGLEVTGNISETYLPGITVDIGSMFLGAGTVWVKAKDDGGRVQVVSMKKSQGTPSYEGALEIRRVDGETSIINHIDMETYLKYVLHSEMPANYPAEALCAQAVCSRTYAVKQLEEGRLEAYGADVDDTVSFQVYNNIDRQERSDEAVDKTCGVIMTCDDITIMAYFFSTSCGTTSTDEVWGMEPAKYLKSISVSDNTIEAFSSGGPYMEKSNLSEEEFRKYILEGKEDDLEKDEAWYRWEILLPYDVLQERVNTRWPELGMIRELEVEKRSDGGAVERLSVTGEGGNIVLENEYDIREFLTGGEIPIKRNDGSLSSGMKILPSAYFILEPVIEGNIVSEYWIRGGGYGHGVGMSQNGAKELAKKNLTWQEILNLFYGNITLKQI
ncbi:MAG: SpoIID/LytB domain-containing protein [Clostridia bacterium]|nr:SpoIID/LytB domain-containing protein [Clostridia bacterium]